MPLAGRTRHMEFGILWPVANGVEPACMVVAAALKSALEQEKKR